MKPTLKGILLIGVIAAFSFAAGHYDWFVPQKQPDMEFVDARPNWVTAGECIPPNAQERAKYELALNVLRTFGPRDYLAAVASEYFVRRQYRRNNSSEVGGTPRDAEPLCTPPDLLSEVAEIALERNSFPPARALHIERLRLARALGPRDPRIIEAVANTAFIQHPIVDGHTYPQKDIRTLARVILAEFGPAAVQWSGQAFDAMNADDALGTTSAQIAVTTGHPGAVERASELLREILDRHPEDPIPLRMAGHIDDLSYAIAWAGPEAEEHSDILIEYLTRKRESVSTSFGILHVTPLGVCSLLLRIGGERIDDIVRSDPCREYLERYHGHAF